MVWEYNVGFGLSPNKSGEENMLRFPTSYRDALLALCRILYPIPNRKYAQTLQKILVLAKLEVDNVEGTICFVTEVQFKRRKELVSMSLFQGHSILTVTTIEIKVHGRVKIL